MADQLTSYTNTTIIKCNRKSSVEHESGQEVSNADFTNVVGDGLQLNVGDTVEVQSAYISEVGAGQDTIEIKGETLKDYKGQPIQKTFNYTEKKYTYPVQNGTWQTTQSMFGMTVPMNYKSVSHYIEEWEQKQVTKTLTDNEATISVNYYKNADGKGYIFQPTLGISSELNVHQTDFQQSRWLEELKIGEGERIILPRPRQVCLADYHNISLAQLKDDVVNGEKNTTKRYGASLINMRPIHDNSRFTKFVRINKKKYNYPWYATTQVDPMREYPGILQPPADTYNLQGAQLSPRPQYGEFPRDYSIFINSRNPSADKYVRYTEVKTLSIRPGFNSPSNIASQITSQLKKTKQPDTVQYGTEASGIANVGFRLESETWKPFDCATGTDIEFYASLQSTQQNRNNGEWFEAPDPNPSFYDKNGVLNYDAQYDSIYIKRPDLYEAGEEFIDNFMENTITLNTLTQIDPESTTLDIDIDYTQDNLKIIKTLFEVQGRYPELMENDNWGEAFGMTRDNCRFLHLMFILNVPGNADNAQIQAIKDYQFGSDNCTELNNTAAGAPDWSGMHQIDYSTRPIWFKYQTETKDQFNNGNNPDQLCYGFALRGANNKIRLTLHTTTILDINDLPNPFIGPPAKLFEYYDGYGTLTTQVGAEGGPTLTWKTTPVIDANTSIGWDKHFNSYGNVVMTAWSGVAVTYNGASEIDYYKQTKIVRKLNEPAVYQNINQTVRTRYMGANDPLFNFDTVESRFTFSRLHCAETTGQSNLLSGASGEKIPDINPDYFKEVYKINPRDNVYEWSPSLMPYNSHKSNWGKIGQVNVQYQHDWGGPDNNWISHGADGEQAFSTMNPNMAPFTVFDSKTGIIISDMGFDSDTWDNSMWNTLGFTYEQFNTIGDFNFNSRVIEDNKFKLPFIVTNSDVVNKDTQSYIINAFGAPMETTQQAYTYLVGGPEVTDEDTMEFQFYPAITKPANSMIIPAQNLPKKMKTGAYYAIRSDLIDSVSALSTNGQRLPIMHICDKQYSGGDFYFSSDNPIQFRVTIPKVITSIRTQITDPDDTYSRCDPDTSIVYKIIRNVSVDLDLADEILKQGKKNN